MLRSAACVALLSLSMTSFGQTQNYFGTSGSIGGSTWSTNPGGPFNQLFDATNGGVMNFNSTAAVTGGTVAGLFGINATANVTLTSPSGTISNFNNGIATIDISSGATLDFSTQSFTSSATAGYIKNGDGVLALAGNSYQGGFTLNSGTVILRGVNAMGGGVANTLTLNGGIVASNASRDLTNKYGGGITIGGDVQIGASSGLANATASLTFTNNVSMGAATRTLTIGNNATHVFNGAFSGSGGLTIAALSGATGSISLGGVSSYAGDTTINGGILRLTTGANRLPTGTAVSIANTAGTSLVLNGNNQEIASLSGGGAVGGNVNLGAGILTISGNASTTYGGAISGSGSIVKSGNGTLTLTGTSSFTGGVSVNSGTVLANGSTNSTGTGNITVDNSAVFGGNGVAGSSGILLSVNGKLAPGTTTSTGTLTIGGQAFVNNVYSWNISQTAAGSDTAVFAGESDAGSIRDLLVVGAGISAGTSALDFNNAIFSVDPIAGVTVDEGKFYSWKVAQLLGGTTARVNGVTIGASPITTNFTVAGAGATWGDFSLSSSGGFVYLNLFAVTPVPEPNTFLAVAISGIGFAIYRVRRTGPAY